MNQNRVFGSSHRFIHTTVDLQNLRTFELELIEKTLADTGGNITKAAEILKIDRTTLSKKLKRLGLKP